MASCYQRPYVTADMAYGSLNNLASAYGGVGSGYACRDQTTKQMLRNVPCGTGGCVTNCPKNSAMDWFVVGENNAIFPILGGSNWPYLESQKSEGCRGFDYMPRLLGKGYTATGTPSNLAMAGTGHSYQGGSTQSSWTAAGAGLQTAYGFNADAANARGYGVGNTRAQYPSYHTNYQLANPCDGTFIR